VTKECREKILRLKIIYFDEFRGPLKGALGGPKGPLRAKSGSFGDFFILNKTFIHELHDDNNNV